MEGGGGYPNPPVLPAQSHAHLMNHPLHQHQYYAMPSLVPPAALPPPPALPLYTPAPAPSAAAIPPGVQIKYPSTSTATSTPKTTEQQLLDRARQGLQQLMGNGNIDSRPSRQGMPAPKIGSCTSCREAKAKCSQGPICTRCMASGAKCEYPVFAKRGRKRAMTPNMILLESIHRDVEAALSALSSSSSSNSSSNSNSSTTTVEGKEGEEATSPRLGGMRGRGSLSPPAVGLLAGGGSATGSEVGGKRRGKGKGKGKKKEDGEGEDDDGEDDEERGTDEEEEEEKEGRELESVIESPLAILAHISSLKITESTEAESGNTLSILPSAAKEVGERAGVEGYFSTGLYQARTDREPMLDPVTLGVLTEQDFERLVGIYFNHLHLYIYHLSPLIHTPRFLRDTSPFLTTALAYAVAGFDPQSQHLIQPLQGHVMFLSDRVFSEGHKTVEIVQGYCLLVHWSPIEANWGDDRRWGWLGQALRIATEIRLDKTLTASTYQFYRSVTVLPGDLFTELAQDRAKTWMLLGVAEIALCVSTGRLGAVQGLNLVGGFRSHFPPVKLGSPHFDLCALEDLNRIYAKAIALSAGLKEEGQAHPQEGLREAFNASWRHDMDEWGRNWGGVNGYVRLVHQHNCTILLSISLRFKGPLKPILEQCKTSATETLKIAANWPDGSLVYASNFLVVNIAYAATLLLRIISASSAPPTEHDRELRTLCRKASDLLSRMGQLRPTTRTLSALHATRIRSLLDASEQKHGIPLPMAAPPLIMPSMFHAHPHNPIQQQQQHQPQHQQHQHQQQQQQQNSFFAAATPAVPLNAPLLPPHQDQMWDMFKMETSVPGFPAPQQHQQQDNGWGLMNTGEGQEWSAAEPGTWAW